MNPALTIMANALRVAGDFEASEHYDRESGTYRLYVRYMPEDRS